MRTEVRLGVRFGHSANVRVRVGETVIFCDRQADRAQDCWVRVRARARGRGRVRFRIRVRVIGLGSGLGFS